MTNVYKLKKKTHFDDDDVDESLINTQTSI